MTICVYKHTNKINGKVYIGQTCNLKRRWRGNGSAYKHCPRFYSAIQSYGWENFSHEVLYDNLSREEANFLERKLIKLYDSTNPQKGYNLQAGGDALGDYWKDEQHRIEQSERRKKYYIDHPEQANLFAEWNKAHPEQQEKHSKFMKEKYQNGENPLCKVNNARKKKVRCVETQEEFESLCSAASKYNLPVGNLSRCVHGQRKTCGNFHWELI